MTGWDILSPYYSRLTTMMNEYEDEINEADDWDIAEMHISERVYPLYRKMIKSFQEHIERPEIARFFEDHAKYLFDRIMDVYCIDEMRKNYILDGDEYDYFSVDALTMSEGYRALADKARRINRMHETCIRNSP